MRLHSLAQAAAAVLIAAIASIAGPGGTVNGVAVSVHYHYNAAPNWNYGYWTYRGSLMRYDIQDGNVTGSSVIADESGGLVQYPAINLEGDKVAFYRWGKKVASDGAVTDDDQNCKISYVGINGGTVTDLVELPVSVLPSDICLDWPAGEWIYYTYIPVWWEWAWGVAYHEIRRVNVNTGVDELVQHLSDPNYPSYDNTSGSGDAGGTIIRFEMSAKGDRAAVKACASNNTNEVYAFPLANDNPCGPGLGGIGSCNIGCSSGGWYATGYGGGWHSECFIARNSGASSTPQLPNYQSNGNYGYVSLGEARVWAEVPSDIPTNGAEYPRWSCNSDKWIVQQVGVVAHAGDLRWGSNQLMINWVDSKAVMTSRNPLQDRDGGGGALSGVTYECNCSGDFWVDGGPAGSYEGADGNWVSVSGSPPTLPGTPSLSSPADNATGQSTSPTLSWNGVSGASTYHVQISTASSFASLVDEDASVSTTSKAISGLSDGATYYWRVRAQNSAGAGNWSSAWSFATQQTPQPPEAPVLASPSNGATDVSRSVTVSWNAASGASAYHLQVSTSDAFTDIVTEDTALTATSMALSGLAPGTTYHWRVRASNDAGSSSWSGTWSFTTADATARDAFSQIEAESADENLGAAIYGTAVGSLDENDWLKYSSVDFGSTAATRITFNYGSPGGNQWKRIEVRLDAPDGTAVGELWPDNTGGYDVFTEKTIDITATTGTHDVYLVVLGGGGVADLDWFVFVADGAVQSVASRSGAVSPSRSIPAAVYDFLGRFVGTTSTYRTNGAVLSPQPAGVYFSVAKTRTGSQHRTTAVADSRRSR